MRFERRHNHIIRQQSQRIAEMTMVNQSCARELFLSFHVHPMSTCQPNQNTAQTTRQRPQSYPQSVIHKVYSTRTQTKPATAATKTRNLRTMVDIQIIPGGKIGTKTSFSKGELGTHSASFRARTGPRVVCMRGSFDTCE